MEDLKAYLEQMPQMIYDSVAAYEKQLSEYEKKFSTLMGINDRLETRLAHAHSQLEALKKEPGPEQQADLFDRDNPPKHLRYYGCYNVGSGKERRKTPIDAVSDVVMILGGPKHMADLLGCPDGSIGGWRDRNALPIKHEAKVKELLDKRGYSVKRSIFWRRGKGRVVPHLEQDSG